jgi:hypothetical protein
MTSIEVICQKSPQKVEAWRELISLKSKAKKTVSSSRIDTVKKNQDVIKVTFRGYIEQISSKSILPLGAVVAGSIILVIFFWSSLHSKVPDVVGQEIDYARGIIQGKEFEVEVLEQVDENLKEGQIISQEPSSGKSLMKGKAIKLTVAKLPVYEIKGSFELFDSDIGGRSKNCYGTGGYGDIKEGMAVTVRDASGNILASTATSNGTSDDDFLFSCKFEFMLEVPSSDFYSITVGRRGELNYSLSEMKKMSWDVSFSLGL